MVNNSFNSCLTGTYNLLIKDQERSGHEKNAYSLSNKPLLVIIKTLRKCFLTEQVCEYL